MKTPVTQYKTTAKRLLDISESTTLRLNSQVQQMKAQGVDIANLTAGEPDFAVHEQINEAIRKALLEKKSKYTAVPGIVELRERVARKTNRQQPGLAQPWNASQVVVSNGGKQALSNTFHAILNPGDEVILGSPYWLSYPDMMKLAGGVPVAISTTFEQGYKITPAQLEKALTPKTRMILFNSPSNPTGATYSREEFEALAQVLTQHPLAAQVVIVSDEIYDEITYDQYSFVSFLAAAPQLADRTVTINGMSKAVAMTGWRVGWTVAPDWITKAIYTYQSQTTSGINALAQWASVAGLDLDPSYFKNNREVYTRRRNLVCEELKKASHLKFDFPHGAFYVFLNVDYYLKKSGLTADLLAEKMIAEALVATVPGTSFGDANSIRLSFSTDEEALKKGSQRIASYLNSL
jgi:aspartate aminotransferase